jgi:Arc/MetJ-type ribon-helix-helix transcriptional regulator
MKSDQRYKALSVTVPPQMERQLEQLCRLESRSRSEVIREALRLYFGARTATDGRLRAMALPVGAEDRRVADLGAFTEWGSELDRAYDVLARE